MESRSIGPKKPKKKRRDEAHAEVRVKFGKRLRRERDERKLTQGQVAKAVDVTQPRVSEWERGLSFPSILQVLRFCAAYGVGLERLFVDLARFEAGQLPLEGLAPEDRDAITHIAQRLGGAVRESVRPSVT